MTDPQHDTTEGLVVDEQSTTTPAGGPDAADAPDSMAEVPHDPTASGLPDEKAGEPGEHPDTKLAAERLNDLQRLNAEYVNYKRRVDRITAAAQERAVHDVLESLLPVLDDIHAARDHGDLTDGPFAAIADKLEGSLGKFGLERFGDRGEAFDPTLHEALMNAPWPEGDPALDGAEGTTVVTVLQPGYRAGEYVIRPARVAVADPS